MRTRVDVTAAAPVVSQGGLKILPTRPAAGSVRPPAWQASGAPLQALDDTLAGISQRYGEATADFVRLQLEYPKPGH